MSLIPWKKRTSELAMREPAASSMLGPLREEMERVFERFFREPWTGERAWAWMPTVDVSETGDAITIRAELPGIDPNEIEVTVSGNVLTIAGRKEESTEEKKEDYYHCERHFGSFRRSIELPSTADTEAITAEQRNGVLTLQVGKAAGVTPKRITVKKTGKPVVRKPAVAAGRQLV
jgi:HSP20 family protein